MIMLIEVLFILSAITMHLSLNLLIPANALHKQEVLPKNVSIKWLSSKVARDVYLFASFSCDSSIKHAWFLYEGHSSRTLFVVDFYVA